MKGLPYFQDGTGQDGMGQLWKIHVPNFLDAGTATEIPSCQKSNLLKSLGSQTEKI